MCASRPLKILKSYSFTILASDFEILREKIENVDNLETIVLMDDHKFMGRNFATLQRNYWCEFNRRLKKRKRSHAQLAAPTVHLVSELLSGIFLQIFPHLRNIFH